MGSHLASADLWVSNGVWVFWGNVCHDVDELAARHGASITHGCGALANEEGTFGLVFMDRKGILRDEVRYQVFGELDVVESFVSLVKSEIKQVRARFHG
ncbi:MAG: hypothetical protein HN396_04590 [Gemmatimonadales bacterium]|jgi:hypothetical protein|nr:hypothetical protein [Gemmatimonadales bacterium]